MRSGPRPPYTQSSPPRGLILSPPPLPSSRSSPEVPSRVSPLGVPATTLSQRPPPPRRPFLPLPLSLLVPLSLPAGWSGVVGPRRGSAISSSTLRSSAAPSPQGSGSHALPPVCASL